MTTLEAATLATLMQPCRPLPRLPRLCFPLQSPPSQPDAAPLAGRQPCLQLPPCHLLGHRTSCPPALLSWPWAASSDAPPGPFGIGAGLGWESREQQVWFAPGALFLPHGRRGGWRMAETETSWNRRACAQRSGEAPWMSHWSLPPLGPGLVGREEDLASCLLL